MELKLKTDNVKQIVVVVFISKKKPRKTIRKFVKEDGITSIQKPAFGDKIVFVFVPKDKKKPIKVDEIKIFACAEVPTTSKTVRATTKKPIKGSSKKPSSGKTKKPFIRKTTIKSKIFTTPIHCTKTEIFENPDTKIITIPKNNSKNKKIFELKKNSKKPYPKIITSLNRPYKILEFILKTENVKQIVVVVFISKKKPKKTIRKYVKEDGITSIQEPAFGDKIVFVLVPKDGKKPIKVEEIKIYACAEATTPSATTIKTTPHECRASVTGPLKKLNKGLKELIGWIEKDGVNGATSPEEKVLAGDIIGKNVKVKINECMECNCGKTNDFICQSKNTSKIEGCKLSFCDIDGQYMTVNKKDLCKCQEGEIMVAEEAPNCCSCKKEEPKKEETCKPITKKEQLNIKISNIVCKSIDEFNVTSCSGGCGDTIDGGAVIIVGKKNIMIKQGVCKCCQGIKGTWKSFKVECFYPKGKNNIGGKVVEEFKVVKKTIKHYSITQCGCNKCKESKFQKSVSNAKVLKNPLTKSKTSFKWKSKNKTSPLYKPKPKPKFRSNNSGKLKKNAKYTGNLKTKSKSNDNANKKLKPSFKNVDNSKIKSSKKGDLQTKIGSKVNTRSKTKSKEIDKPIAKPILKDTKKFKSNSKDNVKLIAKAGSNDKSKPKIKSNDKDNLKNKAGSKDNSQSKNTIKTTLKSKSKANDNVKLRAKTGSNDKSKSKIKSNDKDKLKNKARSNDNIKSENANSDKLKSKADSKDNGKFKSNDKVKLGAKAGSNDKLRPKIKSNDKDISKDKVKPQNNENDKPKSKTGSKDKAKSQAKDNDKPKVMSLTKDKAKPITNNNNKSKDKTGLNDNTKTKTNDNSKPAKSGSKDNVKSQTKDNAKPLANASSKDKVKSQLSNKNDIRKDGAGSYDTTKSITKTIKDAISSNEKTKTKSNSKDKLKGNSGLKDNLESQTSDNDKPKAKLMKIKSNQNQSVNQSQKQSENQSQNQIQNQNHNMIQDSNMLNSNKVKLGKKTM